jgi:hypothetical protein
MGAVACMGIPCCDAGTLCCPSGAIGVNYCYDGTMTTCPMVP